MSKRAILKQLEKTLDIFATVARTLGHSRGEELAQVVEGVQGLVLSIGDDVAVECRDKYGSQADMQVTIEALLVTLKNKKREFAELETKLEEAKARGDEYRTQLRCHGQ